MKLAAKLIRMRIDNHYNNKYNESQINPKYDPTGKPDFDFLREDKEGTEDAYFKSTYSFEDSLEASYKDDRALSIAMKIIAEKGFHWWI